MFVIFYFIDLFSPDRYNCKFINLRMLLKYPPPQKKLLVIHVLHLTRTHWGAFPSLHFPVALLQEIEGAVVIGQGLEIILYPDWRNFESFFVLTGTQMQIQN